MEQIALLDFSTKSIYVYNITEDREGYNTEDLLKELGHNLDDCSVMYGNDIKIISE